VALVISDHGSDNRVEAHDDGVEGQLTVEIRGRRNRVAIGDGLHIGTPGQICVEGDDNVLVLGEQLRLVLGAQLRQHREWAERQSWTWIVVRGDRNRVEIGARCAGVLLVRLKTDGATLRLGTHCTAVGARFLFVEPASIVLGDDCMLSANVDVSPSDGHPIFDRTSGARLNPPADIRLGAHVWVGAGARILKGVEIGDGSVIAAHAVVTRSLPANCVAAGVPARVVRENVVWRRSLREFSARAEAVLED
jgi:acetyltransferase-like isoleucine patch superfamily enzyme